MTSLMICVQISYFLLRDVSSQYPNVASQYPTMYEAYQGLPQMIPYQGHIQQTQYYNALYGSPHRHKSKSKKRRGHKRSKTRRRFSSSDSLSDSENDTNEECDCDFSCNQCSINNPSCCEMFCNDCIAGQMNPEFLYVPYLYPVVVSAPPNEDSKIEDKKDKPEEEKEQPEENGLVDGGGDKSLRVGTKMSIDNEKNATNNKKENKNENNSQPKDSPINKRTKLSKKDLKEKLEKSTNSSETNVNTATNELDTKITKILLDSEKISRLPENEYNDIIFKIPNNNSNGNKFVLTSLRRVKDSWLPKYGIVPIPEKIATDLMTNLRSIKTIQPLRETKMISATEAPKTDIHTIVIREPEDSHDSNKHDSPHNKIQNIVIQDSNKLSKHEHPQKEVQTIVIRDSRAGLTVEGPRSAMQSLNRRFFNSVLSNDQSHVLKLKDKVDNLPLDLVRKIYKY